MSPRGGAIGDTKGERVEFQAASGSSVYWEQRATAEAWREGAAETFKGEVLKGRDLKQAIGALEAARMLVRAGDGRDTHKMRLVELGSTRYIS